MNLAHPIYITGISPTGALLLGGMFRMQDEVGFPIDASFEECKRHGFKIDWLEALCDCWINDCLKYDSFVRQAEMITGENLHEHFTKAGSATLSKYPAGASVDDACRAILAEKGRPEC